MDKTQAFYEETMQTLVSVQLQELRAVYAVSG